MKWHFGFHWEVGDSGSKGEGREVASRLASVAEKGSRKCAFSNKVMFFPFPSSWMCCHHGGLFFQFFPFSVEGNRGESGYFLSQSSPPEANYSCIRTQVMLQKAQDRDDTALQWGIERWALKMTFGEVWNTVMGTQLCSGCDLWSRYSGVRFALTRLRVTLTKELLDFWNFLRVLKLPSSKSNPVKEVSHHPSKYTGFFISL